MLERLKETEKGGFVTSKDVRAFALWATDLRLVGFRDGVWVLEGFWFCVWHPGVASSWVRMLVQGCQGVTRLLQDRDYLDPRFRGPSKPQSASNTSGL